MKYLDIPTRAEFVEAARSYLQIPFEHQGRSRSGVDCLGLLVCIARDLGIDVVDNLNYGRSPCHKTMRAGLLNHFNIIPRASISAGDVLWIKWTRRAYPLHLAIVTECSSGNLRTMNILHAEADIAKRVVEHPLPVAWHTLIVTSLRWRVWDSKEV